MSEPNPFHVLGLPVDADDEEIVRRAVELHDLAGTDEERRRVAWARRELIGRPALRDRHALLEMPGTDYRDALAEERFRRKHRRNPAAIGDGADRGPAVDLAAALDMLLADMLSPPIDLLPALRDAPVRPAPPKPPLEVSDVIFG